MTTMKIEISNEAAAYAERARRKHGQFPTLDRYIEALILVDKELDEALSADVDDEDEQ